MIRFAFFHQHENDSLWADARAAQLVEFAVALPLLVLFVVGIFDFSGAFTLKQRLTNIARDAARAAARDPANDLLQPSNPAGIPASVVDAFQTIDHYMVGGNLSDCGVKSAGAPAALTWTFVSPAGNGCPPPGLTIIVNRGYSFPLTGAVAPAVTCASQPLGGKTALLGTCVSIQYAYPWKFGRVASALGRTTILPNQISAVAVALNEN